MEFTIKNPGGNIVNIGRDIGYILQKQSSNNEVSFVRPLGGDYPRFHLYVKLAGDQGSGLLFSLHIDQKRPIYKQVHDHAAEYDTPVVQSEATRIQKVLK